MICYWIQSLNYILSLDKCAFQYKWMTSLKKNNQDIMLKTDFLSDLQLVVAIWFLLSMWFIHLNFKVWASFYKYFNISHLYRWRNFFIQLAWSSKGCDNIWNCWLWLYTLMKSKLKPCHQPTVYSISMDYNTYILQNKLKQVIDYENTS